ncbi:MAG: hypothetical protein AAFV80_19505, partial [Bacteroidota bacterium]
MSKIYIYLLLAACLIFGNWMCKSEKPSVTAKAKPTSLEQPSGNDVPTSPEKENKTTINTTPQSTSTVQFEGLEVNETETINRLFPDYFETSFAEDGSFQGISKSDGFGENGIFSLEALETYQVGAEGQLHLVFWENVNLSGDLMIEPVWEVTLDSTTVIHYCDEENLIRYGGGQFQWEKPQIESLLRLSDGSIRLTMEQSWTHAASNTKSSEKTMFLLDQGQLNWIFD